MEECTTEQSWLRYTWTFENILNGLPGPGTPAFAALARDLRSYGLSPAGITFDTPGSSLADVSWRITLLEGERALLRICYGFFEIAINYLSDGDDKAFDEILAIVTRALVMLDPDSEKGRGKIFMGAHLTLSASDPETFLGRHLMVSDQNSLSPDSFYYKLVSTGSSQKESMRIGVTRSLAFDNALYVELTGDYNAEVASNQVGDRFEADAKNIFALLGLEPRSKGKVD